MTSKSKAKKRAISVNSLVSTPAIDPGIKEALSKLDDTIARFDRLAIASRYSEDLDFLIDHSTPGPSHDE